MRNLLLLRKICFALILLIVGYHVICGTVRELIDFKYPNGWYDNTVAAFGKKLRILVFVAPQNSIVWKMVDTRPEELKVKYTLLDINLYDYEVEMGWFYQYKTMYAYGRNGFWIIQNDPYHIKLLRNPNIPEKDAQQLDETIDGYNVYGDQFTVVNSESNLTHEEQRAYAILKEKAQPRIETLKAQGLFP